jgi:hypothetical protein
MCAVYCFRIRKNAPALNNENAVNPQEQDGFALYHVDAVCSSTQSIYTYMRRTMTGHRDCGQGVVLTLGDGRTRPFVPPDSSHSSPNVTLTLAFAGTVIAGGEAERKPGKHAWKGG